MTRRRRVDIVGLLIGLVVFATSAVVASRGVAPGETAIFRAINGLPDSFYVVIWPLMQFGVFATIPILIVVALILRRVRLAAAMAVGGIGVYLLAKVVKGLVDRGRPAALFADVVGGRETFVTGSLGYPSGHAAVATAVTVVTIPYLPARWRWAPVVLIAVVLVGRLYVGAHLPLDLVGGASLGVAAGCAANLVVGVPRSDAPVGAGVEQAAT